MDKSKQMIQRLPVALAQVKAGNTSGNSLMNTDNSYIFLCREKEVTKKVYKNDKFNEVIKQNEYYIYEF